MNFLPSNYLVSNVAALATRYVGRYLEGIEPEKFEVAWKGGNLQLSDVKIRREVLDVLELPMTLLYGWIGNVKLSFPLGNIFSLRSAAKPEPLVVELDQLYIIAAPKPEDCWDTDELLHRHRILRQRLLDQCDMRILTDEAQEQIVEKVKAAASQGSGWLARMASRVVADIQFHIRSIHIRFEDSNSGNLGFFFGVTLSSLHVRTPVKREDFLTPFEQKPSPAQPENDEDKKEETPEKPELGQQKLLTVSDFAVYWSRDTEDPFTVISKEDMQSQATVNEKMKNMVVSYQQSEQTTQSLKKHFLLKPFSALVAIDVGPEASSKKGAKEASQQLTGLYKMFINLAKLDVTIPKESLRDLTHSVKTIKKYRELIMCIEERFELFFPYRPNVPVKSAPRIWWRYAVGCIIRRMRGTLGEDVNTSPWLWGEHLKTARIEAWKAEYKTLLRQYLEKTALSGAGIEEAKSIELSKLQELLPRKDLLQVYVETKKSFLKQAVKTDFIPPQPPSAPTDKAPRTWRGWLRGDVRQDGEPLAERRRRDSLESSLDDHTGEPLPFFDAEEMGSMSPMIEEEDAQIQLLDPFEELEEFCDVQEPTEDGEGGSIEVVAKDDKSRERDMVDQLLKAENFVAETWVVLEAATLRLKVPETTHQLYIQTSVTSSIVGRVSKLRVSGAVAGQLTLRIDLLDLAMDFETQNKPSQQFLMREKEGGAAKLTVDVQHIVFGYIRPIFVEVVRFFGYLRKDEKLILGSAPSNVEPENKTLSVKGLSSAKRLAEDNYRNIEIDVKIKAPTIIVPVSQNEIGLVRDFRHSPVLVAHLGALFITSQKAYLPPPAPNPYAEGSLITFLGNQQFQLDLKDIYVDYYESFESAVNESLANTEIIRRFAIKILVQLRTTQEKNIVRAFLAATNPGTRSNRSSLGALPLGGASTETATSTSTVKNSVAIAGTLPALSVCLDRKLFEAVVFALNSILLPMSDTEFLVEEVNPELETPAFKPLVYGADITSEIQPLMATESSQRRWQRAASKLRRTLSSSRPRIRSAVGGSDLADVANPAEKVEEQSTAHEVENVEACWPPDIVAQFSLPRFKVDLDCSTGNNGLLQLVSDSLTVGFAAKPGLRIAVIDLKNLMLVRPLEEPPTRYILSTEELSNQHSFFVLNSLRFPFTESLEETMGKECTSKGSVSPVSSGLEAPLDQVNEEDPSFVTRMLNVGNLFFPRERHSSDNVVDCPAQDSSFFGSSSLKSPSASSPMNLTSELAMRDRGNFISIQINFADEEWSKTTPLQTLSLQKFCEGGEVYIKVNVTRFIRLVFQPKPLEEFILFFKKWPQSSRRLSSKPSRSVAIDNLKLCVPFAPSTREQDAKTVRFHVSVRGVSCVCLEMHSEQRFAFFEFDSMALNFGLRKFGVDITCTLKNLSVTDCSSTDDLQRQLFGVIPGVKCLLTISLKTTNDTRVPYFDGHALALSVTFEQVEIVCLVAKLIRIFYWILNDFLGTLTVSPQEIDDPYSKAAAEGVDEGIAKDSFSRPVESAPIKVLESLWEDNSSTSQSPEASGIKSAQVPDSSNTYKFHNAGEAYLASWLMQAALCKAQIGPEQARYLSETCGLELPAHQQTSFDTLNSPSSPILSPPLVFRDIKVEIKSPTLIIPVSTADARHSKLTAGDIRIANNTSVHPEYGLLEDYGISLENVTMKIGQTSEVLLSNVSIDVHFLRSHIPVSPPHPLWMTFRFSDVPWFLTPNRLRLIYDVIMFNVLQGGSDSSNERKVLVEQTAPWKSQTHSTSSDVQENEDQLPSQVVRQTIAQLDVGPEVAMNEENTIETINQETLNQEEKKGLVTSLFHFYLPGLFVFLSPDAEGASAAEDIPSAVTVAFHAAALQCRISKELPSKLKVDVTVNSARMLHCRSPGSAFRVSLSDSDQELTEVFFQELDRLSQLSIFGKALIELPRDVQFFISGSIASSPKQRDNHMHDGRNHSDPSASQNAEEISREKKARDCSSGKELSISYSSQINTKVMQISVIAPRLIVERSFIEDISSFFLNALPELFATSPQDAYSMPSGNLFFDSFNGLQLTLINASIIIPGFLEPQRAPLLVVRGSCQATKNKNTNWKIAQSGSLREIPSTSSLHKAAEQDDQNSDSQTREDFHSKEEVLRRYIHIHHTISLTATDFFTCNLLTLSSLEVFERTAKFSRQAPEQQGITQASDNHFRNIMEDSTFQALEKVTKTNKLTFMRNDLEIKRLDTVFKDPAMSPIVLSHFISSCKFPSADITLRPSLPARKCTTIRDILGLPAILLLRQPVDRRSQSSSNSGKSAEALSAQPQRFTSSGCNWEDLVRVLCPNVECMLDITEKSRGTVSSEKRMVVPSLRGNRKSFVITMQPISLEISVKDSLFIYRCFIQLVTLSLKPLPLPEAENSNHYDSSRSETNIIPCKTRIEGDFPEVKLLLLNDSLGNRSSPFAEFSLFKGTLAALFVEKAPNSSSRLDVHFSLCVRFFNPHAVAYEPVIENLRAHLIRQSFRALQDESQAKPPTLEFSFDVSKRDALSVNISNVFVGSCVRNIQRWKERFSEEFYGQSDAEALKLSSQKVSSTSGMFKFTPYTIRNSSGLSFIIVVPGVEEHLSHGKKDSKVLNSDNVENLELLLPGDEHRLTQFQVDIRGEKQNSFKIRLKVLYPTEGKTGVSDISIPVDRLGIYLTRVYISDRHTGSIPNFSPHQPIVPFKQPSSVADKLLICKVRVSEGQKRLSVESAAIVSNQLDAGLGLEIFVQHSANGEKSPSKECPKILLPPGHSAGIPMNECATGLLAFRPVVWGKQDLNKLQYTRGSKDDEVTKPSSQADKVESDSWTQGSVTFSWSPLISLQSLWTRTDVIEAENLHPDASSVEFRNSLWFPSGLPRFMPVQTLKCQVHRASKESRKVESKIFMAVVVSWETYSQLGRSCRQLKISIRPPFIIRSTIPANINIKVSSAFESNKQARFTLATQRTLHPLPRSMGVSSVIAEYLRPGEEDLSVTGTIGLGGELRIFNIPLLEVATLQVSPFLNAGASAAKIILKRSYPRASMTDNLTGAEWRRFWIKEGGFVNGSSAAIMKFQPIRVRNREKRSLRLQLITTSLPGHPVEVTLHSPTWLVSHIGLNKEIKKLYPLAFAYSGAGYVAPTPEPLSDKKDDASFFRYANWHPSFKGKSLLPGPASYVFSDPSSSQGPLTTDIPSEFETSESKEGSIGKLLVTAESSENISDSKEFLSRARSSSIGLSIEPAIEEIEPWVVPLDCEIENIQLLCGPWASNEVSLLEIQEDQTLALPITMATETSNRTESEEQMPSSSFTRSNLSDEKQLRECELAVRISRCPLSLAREVRLVTISHKYFILNETDMPLYYRQHQTSFAQYLPSNAKVPVEWSVGSAPHFISIRPAADHWQWGGRICLNTIEPGKEFTYHLAPARNSHLQDVNIRIEKHTYLATEVSHPSSIYRIKLDSPDHPNGLKIINSTRYDFVVRQDRTPNFRSYDLKKQEYIMFAWDDSILPRIIYFFPVNTYYKRGVALKIEDLVGQNFGLIRFNEVPSRFWFVTAYSKEGNLQIVEIHNYEAAQKSSLHPPAGSQILDTEESLPFSKSFQSQESNLENHIVTLGENTPRQKAGTKAVDWFTTPSSQAFLKNPHKAEDSSLSVTILLPEVYISIIAELSLGHVIVPESGEPLPEDLDKRVSLNPAFSDGSSRVAPAEFATIYLEKCSVKYSSSASGDMFAITIRNLQIDNPHPAATYPVAVQRLGLSSSTTLRNYETKQLTNGVELAIDIEQHPLIDLIVVRNCVPDEVVISSTSQHKGVMEVEFARIIILGLIIKADMDLVRLAYEARDSFSNTLTAGSSKRPPPKLGCRSPSKLTDRKRISRDFHSSDSGSPYRCIPDTFSWMINRGFLGGEEFFKYSPERIELRHVISNQRSHVQNLVIHPLLLRFSFTPSSSANIPSKEDTFVMRLFSSLGTVQEVPIYFTAFSLKDEPKTLYAMLSILKTTYLAMFWRQSLALATSVDLLGNPLSTLSHIGAGLSDLVAEPVKSLNEGADTSNVIEGFGKGAKSFWDNTVYGAFNVVSKVSGATAQGLGVLALDEAYSRERQQQGSRRHPRGAAEGFWMGAEAFGKSVVGGLRGLVTEPTKGAEESGFGGVGKGVVGALVKPVAGVFEMTALASGGIQEAAAGGSGVARGRRERRRSPRVFYGADRVVRNYSFKDASINDLLYYVPGINWESFIVDAIVYDSGLDYVTIINDDELLTVSEASDILQFQVSMRPLPHADFFCNLCKIMSCDVVVIDVGASKHRSQQPVQSLLLPSFSGRVLGFNQSSSSVLGESFETAKILHEDSGTDDKNSAVVASATPRQGQVFGLTGVILNFTSSRRGRKIYTSTASIAIEIRTLINEKLSRL